MDNDVKCSLYLYLSIIFFKGSLERILRRKIYQEKFIENHVCAQCYQLVKDFESLEDKLSKISDNLKRKFENLHPTKRGRKRKEELKTVTGSSGIDEPVVEIRKSNRKRKIREIEAFLDTDIKEDNDAKTTASRKYGLKIPQILSSMATKCPHCNFAADSEVQVHYLIHVVL